MKNIETKIASLVLIMLCLLHLGLYFLQPEKNLEQIDKRSIAAKTTKNENSSSQAATPKSPTRPKNNLKSNGPNVPVLHDVASVTSFEYDNFKAHNGIDAENLYDSEAPRGDEQAEDFALDAAPVDEIDSVYIDQELLQSVEQEAEPVSEEEKAMREQVLEEYFTYFIEAPLEPDSLN